jgi:ferric-dicitrate binding protein FerR (iron transport regulator)
VANFPDKSIFNRLLEGELSPEESKAVLNWLGQEELDPLAAELIMKQLSQPVQEIDPAIRAALESKLPHILLKTNKGPAYRAILKSHWLRYAAAIIILFGIGALFFLNKTSKPIENPKDAVVTKKDVAPGREGAILTLEDGSTMVLDSLGNGVIADQNGTKVILRNGQLIYEKAADHVKVAYNTMTTPRGRQFQLVLPDGSKVWMNAASSLRYPIVFTGNERKVEVTGEVYFEVSPNKKMPFKVKVNDETEVEVLGTEFNVNSYKNENSINTSLLKGSVRITHGKDIVVLKPGQQGQVQNGSVQAPIKVVQDVDMDKVMAWKNGVFDFEDATLEEVMRQLERWYDIEVVYEKGVPALEFVGKMGRDLNLSDVLRGLEVSEVHFTIEEGRKLIVKP